MTKSIVAFSTEKVATPERNEAILRYVPKFIEKETKAKPLSSGTNVSNVKQKTNDLQVSAAC
jgi:hypothetical protein